MASLGNTTWKGGSGYVYRFEVYALGTRLRKASGLYIITRRRRHNDGGYRHAPLYVGQTEDLSQPFGKHHKAEVLRQHGANCIFIQSDKSENSRLAKERDLISTLHPVCND
jgi:hypothetical protein